MKISFLLLAIYGGGITACAAPGKVPMAIVPEGVQIREGEVKLVGAQDSDAVALLFEKAVLSVEQGKEEQAVQELRQIISLAPHLSVPHNNLGVVYKRKGLLDKAIEEYNEAIRLKADYAEAHNNLGIAYREKGLFKEAEKAYREAIRFKPDLAGAYFNLGILYELYLNRPREAMEQYRDYLRWDGQKKQEVELWISALEQKLNTQKP